jgi:hypothetical protein
VRERRGCGEEHAGDEARSPGRVSACAWSPMVLGSGSCVGSARREELGVSLKSSACVAEEEAGGSWREAASIGRAVAPDDVERVLRRTALIRV